MRLIHNPQSERKVASSILAVAKCFLLLSLQNPTSNARPQCTLAPVVIALLQTENVSDSAPYLLVKSAGVRMFGRAGRQLTHQRTYYGRVSHQQSYAAITSQPRGGHRSQTSAGCSATGGLAWHASE